MAKYRIIETKSSNGESFSCQYWEDKEHESYSGSGQFTRGYIPISATNNLTPVLEARQRSLYNYTGSNYRGNVKYVGNVAWTYMLDDTDNEIILTIKMSDIDLRWSNSNDKLPSIRMLDNWLEDLIEASEPGQFSEKPEQNSPFRGKKLKVVLEGEGVQALLDRYYAQKRVEIDNQCKESRNSKLKLVSKFIASIIIPGLVFAPLGCVIGFGLIGFAIGGCIGLVGFGALKGVKKGVKLYRRDVENTHTHYAKFSVNPPAVSAVIVPQPEQTRGPENKKESTLGESETPMKDTGFSSRKSCFPCC